MKLSAIVSPMARPIPEIRAIVIPTLACLLATLYIDRVLDVPSPIGASTRSSSTASSALYEIATTVGRTMNASMTNAVIRFHEVDRPKTARSSSPSDVAANIPKTTEGIPARMSIAILSGLAYFLPTRYFRNTAVLIPIGPATSNAPNVMSNVTAKGSQMPARPAFRSYSLVNIDQPYALNPGTDW